MTRSPVPLDDAQRQALRRLCDAIVPRSADMPSASDVDLIAEPLQRALGSRPDLTWVLPLVADAVAGTEPEVLLYSWQKDRPEALSALLQLVIGAYYMTPAVCDRIGYHGQQAQILPRAGFGAEELLMAQMEKPPRYRDVADQSSPENPNRS